MIDKAQVNNMSSFAVATSLLLPISILLAQDASAGSKCFERVYSEAHLEAHPQQQTTSVRLLLLSTGTAVPDAFAIRFAKRDGSTGETIGRCRFEMPTKQLQCYVTLNCDGDCGGFSTDTLQNGNITLVKIADGPGFIHLNDQSVLRSEPDDKAFKLSPAPTAKCKSLEDLYNENDMYP